MRDPATRAWIGLPSFRRPPRAAAYCWLVWDKANPAGQPRFAWLPPCRRLTRPGDYPDGVAA